MGGRLAMIWLLRAARAGVIWVARNPQLAVLMAVVALLAAMGIQSASLRNRLDRAKADAADMKKEIEAHETRDEIDNRVAADRDPRERLRHDWSE
jgi:hypothetical protein